MITDFLMVGAGSCLGGMARYGISRAMNIWLPTTMPWGTFTVNVAGCLVIGLIYGLIDRGCSLTDSMRLFLTVGFCGGFTTYSTFMHENFKLAGDGHTATMIAYVIMSLVAGIAMVYLGYKIVK